jgi:NAD(P)-dependent dehydrogenase (short-subunit alcohol dehydrogenase family)
MRRSELRGDGAGRAVLVTGCSSGIGKATALHLARRGFTVFATVRKPVDAQTLASLSLPDLVPLEPLDLSVPGHFAPILARIEEELEVRGIAGLYAIVNNAGAGPVAPIELLDPADLRRELEARLVGPVRLLQALLPLIRKATGRILWIATPSLMPIPYVASIHACDFAANCLARTLSIELAPWRIPSIFVRCGGIRTAAPQKNNRQLEQALASWPPERASLYAEALRRETAALAAFDAKRTDPERVAETVCKALLSRRPRRVYRVGHLSRLAAALELFPQAVVDRIMLRRSRG